MGIHEGAQVWDAAKIDPDYTCRGSVDRLEIELLQDGSAEVVAYNEGGHNFTRVDIGKLLRFVAKTPELAHLLPDASLGPRGDSCRSSTNDESIPA